MTTSAKKPQIPPADTFTMASSVECPPVKAKLKNHRYVSIQEIKRLQAYVGNDNKCI